MNYGRVEDYIAFQNLTSLNVTGKIVIARYGQIFRGDKVIKSDGKLRVFFDIIALSI